MLHITGIALNTAADIEQAALLSLTTIHLHVLHKRHEHWLQQIKLQDHALYQKEGMGPPRQQKCRTTLLHCSVGL